MSNFDGFPKKTPTFLRGISKNNNKEWFDAHRSDYEQLFLEPARAFVTAVGEELSRIAPHVVAEPRAKGSSVRFLLASHTDRAPARCGRPLL